MKLLKLFLISLTLVATSTMFAPPATTPYTYDRWICPTPVMRLSHEKATSSLPAAKHTITMDAKEAEELKKTFHKHLHHESLSALKQKSIQKLVDVFAEKISTTILFEYADPADNVLAEVYFILDHDGALVDTNACTSVKTFSQKNALDEYLANMLKTVSIADGFLYSNRGKFTGLAGLMGLGGLLAIPKFLRAQHPSYAKGGCMEGFREKMTTQIANDLRFKSTEIFHASSAVPFDHQLPEVIARRYDPSFVHTTTTFNIPKTAQLVVLELHKPGLLATLRKNGTLAHKARYKFLIIPLSALKNNSVLDESANTQVLCDNNWIVLIPNDTERSLTPTPYEFITELTENTNMSALLTTNINLVVLSHSLATKYADAVGMAIIRTKESFCNDVLTTNPRKFSYIELMITCIKQVQTSSYIKEAQTPPLENFCRTIPAQIDLQADSDRIVVASTIEDVEKLLHPQSTERIEEKMLSGKDWVRNIFTHTATGFERKSAGIMPATKDKKRVWADINNPIDCHEFVVVDCLRLDKAHITKVLEKILQASKSSPKPPREEKPEEDDEDKPAATASLKETEWGAKYRAYQTETKCIHAEEHAADKKKPPLEGVAISDGDESSRRKSYPVDFEDQTKVIFLPWSFVESASYERDTMNQITNHWRIIIINDLPQEIMQAKLASINPRNKLLVMASPLAFETNQDVAYTVENTTITRCTIKYSTVIYNWLNKRPVVTIADNDDLAPEKADAAEIEQAFQQARRRQLEGLHPTERRHTPVDLDCLPDVLTQKNPFKKKSVAGRFESQAKKLEAELLALSKSVVLVAYNRDEASEQVKTISEQYKTSIQAFNGTIEHRFLVVPLSSLNHKWLNAVAITEDSKTKKLGGFGPLNLYGWHLMIINDTNTPAKEIVCDPISLLLGHVNNWSILDENTCLVTRSANLEKKHTLGPDKYDAKIASERQENQLLNAHLQDLVAKRSNADFFYTTKDIHDSFGPEIFAAPAAGSLVA